MVHKVIWVHVTEERHQWDTCGMWLAANCMYGMSRQRGGWVSFHATWLSGVLTHEVMSQRGGYSFHRLPCCLITLRWWWQLVVGGGKNPIGVTKVKLGTWELLCNNVVQYCRDLKMLDKVSPLLFIWFDLCFLFLLCVWIETASKNLKYRPVISFYSYRNNPVEGV